MGLFISVEGGEGVGKSTFIRALAAKMQQVSENVCVTFEPGGTEIASQIRSIFVNPPEGETLTSEAELLLVSAARSQHVKNKIAPLLASGGVVISDRFADSSRVYQGVLGSLGLEKVNEITNFVCNKVEPDLTFLLDCDVKLAMHRLRPRNQVGGPGSRDNETASRFDSAKEEVHEKIRQAFLGLADTYSNRFVVLDASKPPQYVLEQAVTSLKSKGYI